MRWVVRDGPGTLCLNYVWMPTWLGINGRLKEELDKAIKDKILGLPMTDESLDTANDLVIEFLCDRCKVPGLFEYLDALKYVHAE